MYIECDNNGNVKTVLIGNVNFLSDNSPYISISSNAVITEKTRVNTDTLSLENVDYVVEGGYQITESTNDEAFELEILQ